jgi:hypothetical protein
LRNKLHPIIPELDAHTRELRKANAQVIAVRNYDIAELLEVGAKRGQLGDQGGSRQLPLRRHASKLRGAYRRRHAAGVGGDRGKEYTERAVAFSYQEGVWR